MKEIIKACLIVLLLIILIFFVFNYAVEMMNGYDLVSESYALSTNCSCMPKPIGALCRC